MTLVAPLWATQAANARTHPRAPKRTARAATTTLGAKIPVEMKREPALERKIKGICRGC
jgi:hypothetical protein